MAYENVTLRKQNVTMVDGYFYMFDEDQDALIVKTDDGTQAYSYPLDSTIDYEVRSLEYDGRNFWSLENPGADALIIRRWSFENYVLKLRKTFNIVPTSQHKFNSEAMAIEHYHLRIQADVIVGAQTVEVYQPKTKEEDFNLLDKLESTMVFILTWANHPVIPATTMITEKGMEIRHHFIVIYGCLTTTTGLTGVAAHYTN